MIKEIDGIILLGTSHVARQSAKLIKETIDKEKPEVVAIELDYYRFKTLMSKKKKKSSNPFTVISDIGLFSYLFMQIAAYVQKKVGKQLNLNPGIDMKTAYLKAREEKITTALIDEDIRVVLRKFKKIPFFKKVGLFFSLFLKGFKKEYREKLNFDVKKGVPDERVVETAIEVLKKEVPILHEILIEGRNRYMVNKLRQLRSNHEGKILAVVGAGHVKGMYDLLSQNNDKNSISVSFQMEVE